MPRPGSRSVIAALGAAVVVLALALLWSVFGRDTSRAEPAVAPEPAARRAEGAGSGQFGRAAPGVAGPHEPPHLARNELGQPLNEDGRPIGPPDKVARVRNRRVTAIDMPTTPPLFTDPEQRRAFKAWWVDEMTRRVEIFQGLEPRDGYPDAAETRALLSDYYDAAEPRGPDESVDHAMQRRAAWRSMWQQFRDDYGAPIKTISSRAGDPQHGQAAEPPLQPPGVDVEDAPAASPADGAPPGRDGDEPGGTAPIE